MFSRDATGPARLLPRHVDGKAKRVGVCLGPEFGTVGPELIHEAAKEAVRSLKFTIDLVLVCGFAFDPHVWEEVVNHYGDEVLKVYALS